MPSELVKNAHKQIMELIELFADFGQLTKDEAGIFKNGIEVELHKLEIGIDRQNIALGRVVEKFVDRTSRPPLTALSSVDVARCVGEADCERSEKAKNAKDFKPFDLPASCTEVSRADYEALSYAFMSVVEELELTDKMLNERDRVIALAPACGPHGPGCLAHAEEWIKLQRSRHIPDFDLKDEDLVFNQYKNGFAVTHKPANFEVRIGGLRSSHANRAACIASLQAHLKAHWSNTLNDR